MDTGLSQNEVQTTDGRTDAKKTLTNNLFIGAVVGILRSEGIIRPDDTPAHPAVKQSIDHYNEYLGFEWSKEMQVADAVVGFEQWLSEAGYHYEAPVLYTIAGLTITATMQTQSGQLSVAMQVYPAGNVELPDVIRAAKGELQDAIGRAFSSTQAIPLPETIKSVEGEEVADVMALRVIKNDGQLQYRIIPKSGRWIKYGIPVFLDKAMEYGFNKFKEGDHAIGGTVMFASKPDGKPLMVTSYSK